ncbi:hypothetical protein BESB_002520 [Besnoitia besnoiti]|uniref:F-box domain-containing protein n=1 Tax=Besnoitia besnoiti TaxID=94643 RepID=A0A2A9MN44_BESBE|nr:hypothetical protein BESB_002520 [Besnoitia besnoiti]PFH37911.1 hypothetical protein BESB_002520 [Besnoitia besnoiti]
MANHVQRFSQGETHVNACGGKCCRGREILQQPDIVGQILSCLPWRERRRLAAVCASWQQAAENAICWTDLDLTFADATTAVTSLARSARRARLPASTLEVIGRHKQNPFAFSFASSPPPFRWIQTLQLSVYSSEEAAAVVSQLLFHTVETRNAPCSPKIPSQTQFPDPPGAFGEPSFQETQGAGALMPGLRRLDIYRGIGARGAGVFQIDTPLHILETLPSSFPPDPSWCRYNGSVCCSSAFSELGATIWPSPCFSSTSTAEDSSATPRDLSPSYSCAVDPTASQEAARVSLLPSAASPSLPHSGFGPPHGFRLPAAALRLDAEFIESSLTHPLSPSSLRPKPQVAESLASAAPRAALSADLVPCGLARLASLECLVVETPLPAALMRGLRGRLPRLRHLSVTQVMHCGRRPAARSGSEATTIAEAPPQFETLSVLREVLETLPSNQLQTLCVSFACVSAPEYYFARCWQDRDANEADHHGSALQDHAGPWEPLIERVNQALQYEGAAWRQNASRRTTLQGILEEDGDEVVDLLTEFQAASLETIWLPDTAVSYATLQRFLTQCTKLSSWHVPGWAALLSAMAPVP